jgi:hypothetical protein
MPWIVLIKFFCTILPYNKLSATPKIKSEGLGDILWNSIVEKYYSETGLPDIDPPSEHVN